MSIGLPYFMTNDDWYEYKEGAEFEEGSNYVLTEEGKKDPKVVESYEEFLKDDDPLFQEDEEDEEAEAMNLFGIKKPEE